MKIEIKPELLKEIVEFLDSGMLCFYHKATGELAYYPKDLEDSGLEEMWVNVTDKIAANVTDYVELEAMTGYQAFKVMEDFVENIPLHTTRQKFIDAISRKKPFRHFNDLLSYYPDLRQQWFAFKLERYINFVKQQFDIIGEFDTTIKQSFNRDFCYELEYHLTRTFDNLPGNKFDKIWCDGVTMPDDNELMRDHVNATKQIVTRAWMGLSGQDVYEMTINLGPCCLENCINGAHLSDCLPDEESLDWIDLDMENRTVKLQLL